MPEPAGAREVLEHLIRGISNGRWLELHELYAEEAVVEYPFALPAPTRLEGRAAIQRYFAAVARMPLELRAHNIVMHDAADPEVIIVEYDYDGLVTTTGRAFQVSNIQVSTVRDGQIVKSRDYHNHLVLADVTGRLPDLITAFTTGQPT
jgi:ketosteroid isomerase-like protein